MSQVQYAPAPVIRKVYGYIYVNGLVVLYTLWKQAIYARMCSCWLYTIGCQVILYARWHGLHTTYATYESQRLVKHEQPNRQLSAEISTVVARALALQNNRKLTAARDDRGEPGPTATYLTQARSVPATCTEQLETYNRKRAGQRFAQNASVTLCKGAVAGRSRPSC
jgi:hypothetical protein